MTPSVTLSTFEVASSRTCDKKDSGFKCTESSRNYHFPAGNVEHCKKS